MIDLKWQIISVWQIQSHLDLLGRQLNELLLFLDASHIVLKESVSCLLEERGIKCEDVFLSEWAL